LSQPLSFQDVILRLQQFWADQGCIIWQPYNVQVGAGTYNPATVLRVLGPEPWKVAYVEPSVRPDDGRYGDNPNRMQVHYQFQVILKPDPGNPQEIYLQSLEAIGIDRRKHDIRFVEDNWQSPALGAWGLGWEVWLDGQEITQFTYFQQAGGVDLDPVSVEITYGLERIVLALQGKDAVWDIHWGGDFAYGDALLQSEIEHCRYYFEVADVDAMRETFDTCEAEAKRALAQDPPLVMPAHDYVLKCSHQFNILDTRGAIGVTERQSYFARMRDLSRGVALAFIDQRERLGFPMGRADSEYVGSTLEPGAPDGSAPTSPAPYVLEIGTEELPADDLDSALEQLRTIATQMLEDAALPYDVLHVYGTPRRLVLHIESLAPRQRDEERLVKGPPVKIAFDDDGNPTKAAEGFAAKQGIDASALERREMDGGEYAVASVKIEGRSAAEVLAERLPDLVASLRFQKSMRWNASGVSFSRPVRWLVSLYGGMTVPFAYAGLVAGRTTRGTRPDSSPEFELNDTNAYFKAMEKAGIVLDRTARRESVREQVAALAKKAGGAIPDDPGLLDEVSNLIERPTALLGRFDEASLNLPRDVLVTVMKRHQRYFAIERDGELLPAFVAVRNGDEEHLDEVTAGNEHVIRARFKDADFFYKADTVQSLEDYLPKLDTLTFQETLGSMLDKSRRVEQLTAEVGGLLGLNKSDLKMAQRAAHLCKADLATQMVVEFTSLQGVMGA
jgi:glycyl-tRNA synthetase